MTRKGEAPDLGPAHAAPPGQSSVPGGQMARALHPADRVPGLDQHRRQPFVAVPLPGQTLSCLPADSCIASHPAPWRLNIRSSQRMSRVRRRPPTANPATGSCQVGGERGPGVSAGHAQDRYSQPGLGEWGQLPAPPSTRPTTMESRSPLRSTINGRPNRRRSDGRTRRYRGTQPALLLPVRAAPLPHPPVTVSP